MENGDSAERMEREAQAENAPESDLNELLRSNTGLQSQFDRLVAKALNTARTNWERERGEAGAQAEDRLRGQNEAEREQALLEREWALELRERRAGVLETLEARGLPTELADCLPMQDGESAAQSLDALEKAFTAEVRRAVEERLKGMPPKGGGETAYASQMRAALGLK